MIRPARSSRLVSLAAVVILSGCTYFHAPRNQPLQGKPGAGYGHARVTEGDCGGEDETFVVLTLSGGGTRAAALAYGVLVAMNRHRLPQSSRTLLDEADIISSVSGGSFAAAYYGVFGKEKFLNDFRADVLDRPLQCDLIRKVAAPWNWLRLLAPRFGRADLASEYYDENIFRGARYANLQRSRPLILLNATDITLGSQFTFVQDDFDKIGSDLDSVSVARAVTASSAFPVAFTPLTFDNYSASSPITDPPEWIRDALKDFEDEPTNYRRAENWISYSDPRRPYLHLSDGGLSDNIGLRGPLNALTRTHAVWPLLRAQNERKIKRILFVVVDAKPRAVTKLDRSPRPPGFISVLNAAATNPMENYSTDTVELLRREAIERERTNAQWQAMQRKCDELAHRQCSSFPADHPCAEESRQRCTEAFDLDEPPNSAKLYVAHVRLAAADNRHELERIDTALQLPPREVQLLIDAGAALLGDSSDFQSFLADLQQDPPTIPAPSCTTR